MQKKNGNAKRVETKRQKKGRKAKEAVDPLSQPIVIPDKIRKLALGAGIPLDQIVDRANLIQGRILGIEGAINLIAQGLDKRDEKIAPLVKLAEEIEARRKAMPQAPQQVPQQRMGRGGGLLEGILEKAILGGGVSENPMMKLFMEQVIKSGLESMNMGNILMKTYVQRVAPGEFAKAIQEAEETAKKIAGASSE